MSKKKNVKLKDKKIRCIVTGKILKNHEAISIKEINTYLEKQGSNKRAYVKKNY